jgi:hypothetical protein
MTKPQKRKTFPNPSSSEVKAYSDMLRRCRTVQTAESVVHWAKQHGVFDLANSAIHKIKDLRKW